MALRIALFGQAAFGKDVLEGLLERGHSVVGVYAPPEGRRPDPLAEAAKERGLPLFRHKRFRRKGEAIPDLVEEHRKLGAELNVLAFVTTILPPEIVDGPPRGSLCFHPSLLPKYRGGSALAWQIMLGESEAGVTVFRPDAGIDTGPIVVQKGPVPIEPTDNAASLYFQKLYPLGVEACLEAVDLVDRGEAAGEVQDESRASFQGLVGETEARIDWSRPAAEIDRQIRGCDPQPGAWALHRGERVSLHDGFAPGGETAAAPGTVLGFDEEGRLLLAASGGRVAVGRVRREGGKKVAAAEGGLAEGDRLE